MARAQKLKVFRTPIGFHDAYVAAPSRKAALTAWGSDVDLFARGVAEEVTDDAALMRAPLERPGEVIKLARGSTAEHLAAASAKVPASTKPSAPVTPRKASAPRPRPSRARLKAAEDLLADIDKTHRQAADALKARAAELERQRKAIDRDRQTLDTAYERKRRAAAAAVDRERERHTAAFDAWLADQQS